MPRSYADMFPYSGDPYASFLEPQDRRRMFGMYAGLTGLGLLSNANVPLSQRRPISDLIFQGMGAYQQGLGDLAQGRLASAQFGMEKERFEAEKAEAERKRQADEEARRLMFGQYAQKPWLHPDTGQQVTGGLAEQMGLTQPQQALMQAQMAGANLPTPVWNQMFPQAEKGTQAHQDALNLGLQQGTPEYAEYIRRRTLPQPSQGTEFERLIAGQPAEKQDELRNRRLDKLLESEQNEFGTGLEGQAYNALLEYNAYIRAGQEPPPDVAAKARTAEHILNTPKMFRDPQGNLMTYTPGVPEGFATPTVTPSPAVQPGTAAAGAPGPHRFEEAIPKAKPSFDRAYSTLETIADILDESGKTGETITGIPGWIKTKTGGFARQAGIPVSPMAERLARQLEMLQAQLAPDVLQESGRAISDKDRERLDRIVGKLSPGMDEVGLRAILIDLYDLLQSLETQ